MSDEGQATGEEAAILARLAAIRDDLNGRFAVRDPWIRRRLTREQRELTTRAHELRDERMARASP